MTPSCFSNFNFELLMCFKIFVIRLKTIDNSALMNGMNEKVKNNKHKQLKLIKNKNNNLLWTLLWFTKEFFTTIHILQYILPLKI